MVALVTRPKGATMSQDISEQPTVSREALPAAPDPLELRLARDEARLERDEARLAADEQAARSTRALSLTGVAIAGALVLATAALVVATVALRRDVHAIRVLAPPGSVATASLRDGAVTADKLAPGAVTPDAIAAGAIGPTQLAPNAVSSPAVAPDALTGADIRESTLAPVPQAGRTATAADAQRLAGAGPSAYLAHVRTVRVSTELSTLATKGPLRATCPEGTNVVSGGVAVEGAVSGIAIVRSAPDQHGWSATAHRSRHYANPWRLVVTAICGRGGA
jgi:hypothetical protein